VPTAVVMPTAVAVAAETVMVILARMLIVVHRGNPIEILA
jgi:hypothetical protein